jgi:predicted DNA-binding protein with PD1-like motif
MNHPHMLILKRGDSVMDTILKYMDASKILTASLSGIGAVENPELAYYNMETKRYETKKFTGIFEVVSLNGNISFSKEKLFPHIHVVIGNREYQTFAGHLMKGIVGATLEITVVPLSRIRYRKFDPEIGLDLLSMEDPK